VSVSVSVCVREGERERKREKEIEKAPTLMREISSQLSLMHSAMAFPWSPPTAMILFVADRELAYLCSLAWKNGSTITNSHPPRPLSQQNKFASRAD
jgi:hypothetical protein